MYLVDAVLKISPGDKDAVHSKVIALIELSRFEEAVAVIDSTKFAAELAFEKVGNQCGLPAMTHMTVARDLKNSISPGVLLIPAWELHRCLSRLAIWRLGPASRKAAARSPTVLSHGPQQRCHSHLPPIVQGSQGE